MSQQLRALAIAGLTTASFLSLQQAVAFPKTDAEFALLPPYCKARAGRTNQADVERWESVLGRDFLHVHHYCSALNHINRADQMFGNTKLRDRELEAAIGGFSYMQEHAQQDFILQPEISLKKGRVLLRLGRAGEALNEFLKAIKLKQDYAPAYAALSDLYLQQGDRSQAKTVLEEGLKHSPNSTSLQRRLRKLSSGANK